MRATHGGPDGGPEPAWDFSTNANPLGPCPAVLNAVRSADLTRYPDPAFTRLRAGLGARHHVAADRIVVGAGASELILRLVRASRGPVLLLGPTFGEYARCAQAEGYPVITAQTQSEFLARQPEAALGFVCWPNNPTGACWAADFLNAASRRGRLVIDLAYAPMGPEGIEPDAAGAIRLYAPNKSFGLTGLRAGYAVLTQPWPDLEWLAPAWVLGAAEVAFLQAVATSEAETWLASTRPVIATWRRDLAQALRDLGLAVQESPVSFLLAEVGDAAATAARLRLAGLRVRDAASFGLPGWIRLRAAPPEWRLRLIAALADALR
ncbi:MAG: histidinol-phosphate aminotransferase family protein [Proteobacteria bacterium]|nr:histidinol-phosphate aminotransferase family protein [Pseudomonadota bacterium]